MLLAKFIRSCYRPIPRALILSLSRYSKMASSGVTGAQETVEQATAVAEAHTHITADQFPATPGQILQYWFGKPGDEHHMQFRKLWFFSTPEIDEELRSKFSEQLQAAQAGGLQTWEELPETMAAKIILLDQFSRNVYRGSPKAFAGDAEALRCSLKGLKLDEESGNKFFRSLPDMIRYFCLMPLMHAENIEMQILGEKEFKTLSFYSSSEPLQKEVAKHKEMIERFGRFPHRNAILGRESTPEELAYLKASDNHYGQKAK
jgi:uncharacterized protein (DUF924 family)